MSLYHYRVIDHGTAILSEIVCMMHLQQMRTPEVIKYQDARDGVEVTIKEYEGEFPCKACYRLERRYA